MSEDLFCKFASEMYPVKVPDAVDKTCDLLELIRDKILLSTTTDTKKNTNNSGDKTFALVNDNDIMVDVILEKQQDEMNNRHYHHTQLGIKRKLSTNNNDNKYAEFYGVNQKSMKVPLSWVILPRRPLEEPSPDDCNMKQSNKRIRQDNFTTDNNTPTPPSSTKWYLAQSEILAAPEEDPAFIIDYNRKLECLQLKCLRHTPNGNSDDNPSNSSSISDTAIVAPLAPLIKLSTYLKVPQVLVDNIKDIEIRSVNLWYAPHCSATNYHYDSYHNLLCVYSGHKVIHLKEPDSFQAAPISDENSNHPLHLVINDSNQMSLKSNSSTKVDENHDNDNYEKSKAKQMIITVNAGEALFIPNGFWHKVQSSAKCVAVNYWFQLKSESKITKLSHLLSFRMRDNARRYLEMNMERSVHFWAREQLGEHRAAKADKISRREWDMLLMPMTLQERSQGKDEDLIRKYVKSSALEVQHIFTSQNATETTECSSILNIIHTTCLFILYHHHNCSAGNDVLANSYSTTMCYGSSIFTATSFISQCFPEDLEHSSTRFVHLMLQLEPFACYALSQCWANTTMESTYKAEEERCSKLFAQRCGSDVLDVVEHIERKASDFRRMITQEVILEKLFGFPTH